MVREGGRGEGKGEETNEVPAAHKFYQRLRSFPAVGCLEPDYSICGHSTHSPNPPARFPLMSLDSQDGLQATSCLCSVTACSVSGGLVQHSNMRPRIAIKRVQTIRGRKLHFTAFLPGDEGKSNREAPRPSSNDDRRPIGPD